MDALQSFPPSTLSVQQWTRILWLGASALLQPGSNELNYRDVFMQALILTWSDDVRELDPPDGFGEKQQEASLKPFDALWKVFPKAKEGSFFGMSRIKVWHLFFSLFWLPKQR